MLSFSIDDMQLITSVDKTPINILSYQTTLDPPELFIYKIDSVLIPGNSYQLTIKFQGEIESGGLGLVDNFGFYAINYVNAGINQTMFVTLGECCFERRIYPGFDELGFKAPTQLTFIAPTKYTVTSNTPVISESTSDDLKTTLFAPTQSIVSYLVAFSVFEQFSTISTWSKQGINVTAWGRSDIADQIVDSASYGAILLDFYSEYFGINFPYPKMDFILMPDQVRHNLLAALYMKVCTCAIRTAVYKSFTLLSILSEKALFLRLILILEFNKLFSG